MNTPAFHTVRTAFLPRVWMPILLLFSIAMALLTAVQSWSEALEFQRLDDLATRQLDLHVAALESEITRHTDLPSLIAIHPDVHALTRGSSTPSIQMRERTGRMLAKIAARSGTRQIYVVDQTNTVQAASDWYAGNSLQGHQLRGIDCTSVVTGTMRVLLFDRASQAPEYHFVHAIGGSVAEPRIPDYCVVTKISLTPMESTWTDLSFRPDSEKMLVLDNNNVVVLSSVPYWRYKATDIFSQQRHVARSSTEEPPYYPIPVTPLEIKERRRMGRGALWVDLANAPGAPPEQFISHQRVLASTGWQIVLLSNPERALSNARSMQWLVAAVLALCTVLALHLYQRHRAMRQLLAAREALQHAHDQLERTVDRRTEALSQANTELLHQIHERQHAEAELLQAKKMAALGQMSAKISHEISQPLTALRALATNTKTFLSQENWGRADENMDAIASIVSRMSNITRQLRLFSGRTRQHPLPSHPVCLSQTINSAQRILRERFESESVALIIPDTHHTVRGQAVQLEQVFINLFSNALDALATSVDKTIEVTILPVMDRDRLQVSVRDSGSGIPEELRNRLFEPFHTSKPSGKGLGLGLTICASIVREHGGTLEVRHESAGTVFVFELMRWDEPSCRDEHTTQEGNLRDV